MNIREKFSLFNDYFNLKIVVELNGQQVKLFKFKSGFVWHKPSAENEVSIMLFEPAATLSSGDTKSLNKGCSLKKFSLIRRQIL